MGARRIQIVEIFNCGLFFDKQMRHCTRLGARLQQLHAHHLLTAVWYVRVGVGT